MREVKVHPLEKKLVGSTYRLLQRLNPLLYYYGNKITEETKKYSSGTNLDDQIHSIYSDGDCTPEHIFNICEKRGIEAFAITDHDTIEHWDSCERAEKKYSSVVNIPAIEVSTRGGDLLAYFPTYKCKNSKPVKKLVEGKKLSLSETIRLVHKAGGIVIAPHPDRTRGIGLRELIKLSKNQLDAVEEINVEAGENEYAYFGKSLHIASTAGSDSHSKTNIGSAFTNIPEECYKNSFENGKLNKDMFRKEIFRCIKEDIGSERRLKPVLAVKSGFEQNVSKFNYANLFVTLMRVSEYFFDPQKKVARRLEACLESEE